MGDIQRTQYFKATVEKPIAVAEVLDRVYHALAEKGYNPINQLVGYIISGDLGYISSYKETRNRLSKIDRSTLVEVILKEYLK